MLFVTVLASILAVVLTENRMADADQAIEQDPRDEYGLTHLESERIMHGQPVEDAKEYPWAVAVMGVGVKCGGTLINNRYVLTAAHCLLRNPTAMQSYRSDNGSCLYKDNTRQPCYSHFWQIRVMLNWPTRAGMERRLLEKVILHPRVGRYHNNIALLKLRYLNASWYVNPILLVPPGAQHSASHGNHFKFATWPSIHDVSQYEPTKEDLALGELQRVDITECETIFGYWDADTNQKQICVKSAVRQFVCYNDVGSGVFYKHDNKYYLIGFIANSDNPECHEWNTFLVTDIRHYYSWIEEVTGVKPP